MKTETVETPPTVKEIALERIASRIRGLQATIDHYEARVAEEQDNIANGRKFFRAGVIYPVDYDAINREIARMEAARKDVKKWKN